MNTKKKGFQYTRENVQSALLSIKSGMSVNAASQKYKIPRSTLTTKRDKKYPDKKPGPETILSGYEESVLENWILDRSRIAAPVTKEQLLNSVQQMVSSRKNPFTNNRPGRHWYLAFMSRHSQLSERVAENLTFSRATVSENDIKMWFKEIEDYLTLHNLKDIESTRVFNADETALMLNPKGNGPVIVKKGSKIVYKEVDNNEKESLSTLIMGNAAGDLVPPLILFGYQRLPGHIINKLPKGWGIGLSDNGWMTGQTFFEYIANIFHPWLLEMGIKLPVILFIDGHVSHLTQPLSVFCMQRQIVLIALHPNCTHILQPMDVSMFRPFKIEYGKVVENYRIEQDQLSVQKADFALLVKKTINNLDVKQILQNGFKTCGLYPFDVNAIDYGKLLSSKRNNLKSAVIQNDIKENKNALKCIEQKISAGTIDSFKLHESRNWTGKAEDKSLFELWWDLSHPNSDHVTAIDNGHFETNEALEYKHRYINVDEKRVQIVKTANVVVNIGQSDPLDVSLFFDESGNLISNEHLEQIYVEEIDENIDVKSIINTENSCPPISVCDPLQDVSNLRCREKKDIDSRVPSPFKQYLYWPKEKVLKQKVRNNKEKLPSVVTTDHWLKYQYNRDEKKRRFEEEKEERKKIRLAKAEIKKEKNESAKKKKLEKENDAADKKNVITRKDKVKEEKKKSIKPKRIRKVTGKN